MIQHVLQKKGSKVPTSEQSVGHTESDKNCLASPLQGLNASVSSEKPYGNRAA